MPSGTGAIQKKLLGSGEKVMGHEITEYRYWKLGVLIPLSHPTVKRMSSMSKLFYRFCMEFAQTSIKKSTCGK